MKLTLLIFIITDVLFMQFKMTCITHAHMGDIGHLEAFILMATEKETLIALDNDRQNEDQCTAQVLGDDLIFSVNSMIFTE